MLLSETCSITIAGQGANGAPAIAVMNDGLAEERVQHAIPLLLSHDGWVGIEEDKVFPFLVAGIAPVLRKNCTVFVGWAGQAITLAGRKVSRGAVMREGYPASIVRDLTNVDDVVYSAGLKRQAYKTEDGSNWTVADGDAVYSGEDHLIGFEAISGFNENELYACGTGGELWFGVAGQWQPVSSPTNVHLHAIVCGPHGRVYAGGRLGTLLVGRHDQWEQVPSDLDGTIWSLAYFKSHLYVFSDAGTYQYDGEQVTPVEDPNVGQQHLHSAYVFGDALWCFGRKVAFRYDGEQWAEIPLQLKLPIDPELLGFFDDTVLEDWSPYLEDD